MDSNFKGVGAQWPDEFLSCLESQEREAGGGLFDLVAYAGGHALILHSLSVSDGAFSSLKKLNLFSDLISDARYHASCETETWKEQ